MLSFAGLIGLLLVTTAEATVGDSSQVPFCTETEECLLFQPVCQNNDYEVRLYESAKWVTTQERSYIRMYAEIISFRRLFNYITGANDNGININMTAPVIVKVMEDFWGANVYTMSFLLPSEHQQNPPNPTDSKVVITTMPDMKVYLKSYGGWMMGLVDWYHANQLKRNLDRIGARYQNDYHFAVGYNSPMTMKDRHNEVWYIVEGEPVCE